MKRPRSFLNRRRKLRARRTYRTKRRYLRARRSRRYGRRRQLSVKRCCFVGTFTPATTVTENFYHYVAPTLGSGWKIAGNSMNGLSNLSEYQALFDQYRIGGLKITFKPRYIDYNFSMINPSSGTTLTDRPLVSIVMDSRGTTTPTGTYGQTSYNAFTETGVVRIKRADKDFSVYVKPKIVEQFGGGATRYISPRFADMDASGTAMPHRGFYMYWHTQNTLATGTPSFGAVDVYVTYYVKFIGQK